MAGRLKLAICLESTIGGTRKHAREIALGLDPDAFEVHLVVSLRRGREMVNDFPALLARGVSIHEVPMTRTISPAADARAVVSFVRLFLRERFDVVHTHSAKAGFIGRLAARLAHVPKVVHTPHVWPFQWARGAARAVYFELERAAAFWCHALVCVGEGQRAFGIESKVAPGGMLVLIENGIDPSAYDARGGGGDRVRVRGSLGLLPGEVAVGMVARMAPQKGVGRFLEAASRVASARPDVRFFLAGSGPLSLTMRRRARELGLGPARFRFLGHREDVPRLYTAFDVFALSSLYEGLPYVILEAMSARLPVVATRAPGIEDVVEEGVTGRLVPLDEPGAIARALLGLVSDGEARRRMGEAARALVEERFPLSRFVEAHAELYRGGRRSGAGT